MFYHVMLILHVLQTRIVDPLVQDKLMWFYSKDGLFSVSLAYHMQFERTLSNEGGVGQANRAENEKAWKKLWSLHMIPKVKEFTWRAGRDILPCKVNLARRNVSLDDRCDLCGREETGLHCLYECKVAKKVWKLAPDLTRFWMGKSSVYTAFLEVFLT